MKNKKIKSESQAGLKDILFVLSSLQRRGSYSQYKKHQMHLQLGELTPKGMSWPAIKDLLNGLSENKILKFEQITILDKRRINYNYIESERWKILKYALIIKDWKKLIEYQSELNKQLKPLGNSENTNSTHQKNKINIYISKQKGIYRTEKVKTFSYPILGKSKRAKYIWFFNDNTLASIKDLELISRQNHSLISKEISEINFLFKAKLNLPDSDNCNLIIHHKTSGYQLNNSKYKIIFK